MKTKYIAVIHKKTKDVSSRKDGTWACLIGNNKQKLIQDAFRLKSTWESNTFYGPYTISIGVLKETAVIPNFKLEKY